MCVCHTRNTGSHRSAGESECAVLGRSVRLCVCVIPGMPSSCRSAGESECVCRAGPSVYVCVSYEECRLAVGLPDSECVVLDRSVCLCVCCIRGMPSSCWSAGEIEYVLLDRSVSVCVCVSYEECRVAVNLLESECVVLGGPSVCAFVIGGMPSSCRSAGEI